MAIMDEAAKERWLVLRAQSGDREALDELLKCIQQPLFRYLARLTGNEDLAGDVLQDVFVLLYRKLAWLDDPDLFRSWTYRIASREAFRRLRSERVHHGADPDLLEELPSPEREESFCEEWIEQLPRWVDRVSPASRAVIILHYLQEMPLREVGDVLDITLGTVKSRLSYGLRILARMVQEEQGAHGRARLS
jgi:RNA polymerase sigma-70 factor (ECF subfamily)